MDTKEPTKIADILKHNWEFGSGGAGPIGRPAYDNAAPAKELTDGKGIASNPKYTATLDGSDDLLRRMVENLQTQDNLATQDPLYVVYQKELVTGLEDGYSDFWAWITDDNKEHEEADADMMKVLDQLLENCEPLVIGSRTYRRIGCKYVDKFASAFLTRKAAEDYIFYNSHHLEQPYIFVESLDRNPELAAVRKYFMSKGA